MALIHPKVVAEKRAWEICGRQARWRLVTVLPGLVLGPVVTARRGGESVRLMMRLARVRACVMRVSLE